MAAHIVALAWCFTFFSYYIFAGSDIIWGYAAVDAAAAAAFRRQSRRAIFALPLYYIHVSCLLLYFAATILDVGDWWVFVIANRLFEAEIAYVAGCSLFRIRKLRRNEKGRAGGAPRIPI